MFSLRTYFYTGFPGFITSRLIAEAFEQDVCDEAYVVVEACQSLNAEVVAATLLTRYPAKKIHIIEGDITLPNLGLTDSMMQEIAPRVSVLWHLAAIYDLAVVRKLAWRVNVHGTSMVNDFAKRLPNLARYMYFSTAYVAGTRTGQLKETELTTPAAFKNYYEETKFEAELLVEDCKTELPITILRPGIVCGHAITGETNKFDGPYFLMNLIDRLRKLPTVPYIGKSKAKTELNVVPVNYIIEAATYLALTDEAIGSTVHLTDPSPHLIQEVYRNMVKEMTGQYPFGNISLNVARRVLANKKLRTYFGVEQQALDYLAWQANFDTTVADRLLKNSTVKCPDFIAILPVLITFYEAHKRDSNRQVKIL